MRIRIKHTHKEPSKVEEFFNEVGAIALALLILTFWGVVLTGLFKWATNQ